jgi:hypothetical protein
VIWKFFFLFVSSFVPRIFVALFWPVSSGVALFVQLVTNLLCLFQMAQIASVTSRVKFHYF